ncbi:MAG: sulfatase [Verrucomicrobiota bacterium]
MSKPNIILINCDDLGYGDLGCYGSTLNQTPAIDRLCAEGLKLTSFYMASPICTPSRGAMLTGSLPQRIGFNRFGVLFPGDRWGLHPEEKTIATLLKEAGYATGMVGKWHLGDQPEFLPTQHGFDFYFGLPFSNDMGRMTPHPHRPPLPLLLNDEVLEQQPEMESLTQRYTSECVRWIREHRDEPFFLYLAHLHPHLPHLVAPRFVEQAGNGEYGAAVEYIDWSTDVIMAELKALGLEENTIVIFTSDNGSRVAGEGGSNSPLRGTKRTNWEGGVRLPGIVRWPARIKPGSSSDEVTSSLDLLPTLCGLAGAEVPHDRVLDGHDISPIWLDPAAGQSPHAVYPYYFCGTLEALRVGPWKLHLRRREPEEEEVCELYHLDDDLGETTDLAAQQPEKVKELLAIVEEVRNRLGDKATGQPGRDMRPVGVAEDPKPLTEYDPDHPYMVAMYDGKCG